MVARILSIAGTDPTGGAGVHADLKSILAAGGYGMGVVTAVVSQNTSGVKSVHTPGTDVLRDQLEAVFSDVEVDAVKIGMLGDADTTEVVAEYLKKYRPQWIILDPVMVASSGDRLLVQEAEKAVKDLVPQVDVVTPNLQELTVLLGTEPATDVDSMLQQARQLAEEAQVIVIAKGGHLANDQADNAVVRPDGRVHLVKSRRIETTNTHGTGCSLSSALATKIGAGHSVEEALEWSTRWLAGAIARADELHVGSSNGNGPVDHGWKIREQERIARSLQWWPQPAEVKPVVEPAGPHTEKLWKLAEPIMAQIYSSEFVSQLADGTLPEDDFYYYIDQDAKYLNVYSRTLASLSTTAPEGDEQLEWLEQSRGILLEEMELHRGRLEAEVAPISPITQAYNTFLSNAVNSNGHIVGCAAVLPCFWLYAEIGVYFASRNHADHPYHDWLAMYGGDGFTAGAKTAIERVEKQLETASDAQREAAAKAFEEACHHEREFFAQASRRW